MAKSNSDLENLFKSLLSQAMIVKKFVDINSKVNYCEYLFEMAKECIKLHNSIQKTNIEKLPFSHANNLLDKAFSILTILKMGETTLDVDMYMQCIRMSILGDYHPPFISFNLALIRLIFCFLTIFFRR